MPPSVLPRPHDEHRARLQALLYFYLFGQGRQLNAFFVQRIMGISPEVALASPHVEGVGVRPRPGVGVQVAHPLQLHRNFLYAAWEQNLCDADGTVAIYLEALPDHLDERH